MHYFHWISPSYALSGLVVGILVGMTGVGGGSLMTPLLVMAFGISPLSAVGTDLPFACVTKTVGTAVHGFSGTVDWRIVGRLALGSLPATALTVFLLWLFQSHIETINHIITTVLGIALLLTSVAIAARGWLLARMAARTAALSPRRVMVTTVLLGAAIGVLVTLSSVGAGAIGMTALVMLYPTLPSSRLVGSDIAHAVPLTLVAGLGKWALHEVDFTLLGTLLVGSVPGIVIGSLIATRISDRVLRPILASTLSLVGAKLTF